MRILLLMMIVAFAFLGSPDATADRYGGYDDEEEIEAECISGYGKTACGYSCIAAYGTVRCAATPAGTCESAYGKVACWDPPRWVFSRYRGRVPKAECESAYGQIACGYHCESAYGQVACASSPAGRCVAAYGEVVCSR